MPGWWILPSIRGGEFHSAVIGDYRSAADTNEPIQILPAFSGLTDSEKEALRHAVGEKFLKDEGWSCDQRIINDKGREIFKVGFATAIRKILKEDSEV